MTKEQIKELFNKTAEKAEVWTKLTLDKDEHQDLMIDDDNRIHLHSQLTPYKVEDVKLIKYRINENDDSLAGNSLMIIFRNGDAIRIDNICFDAIINFQVYEDIPRFKTWQDVKNQLEVCFEKTEINEFSLQQSEHSYADIYFDNETLYISNSIETPYTINDIKMIQFLKYSENEKYEYGSYDCVRITFRNGDHLSFLEYGEYEAYIKIGNAFHYFDGIEDIAHRYALDIKAIEQGVAGNEFVIIDSALISYYGDKKEIVIPEGIETIEKQVFQHNNIKSVVFPSTLRKIHERCFGNCRQLVTVILNNGLEVIEKEAFSYCGNLTNIELPNSLKRIGSQAFFCTQLSEDDVVFPPNCELGSYMFNGKE